MPIIILAPSPASPYSTPGLEAIYVPTGLAVSSRLYATNVFPGHAPTQLCHLQDDEMLGTNCQVARYLFTSTAITCHYENQACSD